MKKLIGPILLPFAPQCSVTSVKEEHRLFSECFAPIQETEKLHFQMPSETLIQLNMLQQPFLLIKKKRKKKKTERVASICISFPPTLFKCIHGYIAVNMATEIQHFYINYFHIQEFTPIFLLQYQNESPVLTYVRLHYAMTNNKVQLPIQVGEFSSNLQARQTEDMK